MSVRLITVHHARTLVVNAFPMKIVVNTMPLGMSCAMLVYVNHALMKWNFAITRQIVALTTRRTAFAMNVSIVPAVCAWKALNAARQYEVLVH
jgi:hypothetical protein